MTAALEFDILHILRKHRLIEPGSTLVVAVSGGPDSMALLHILASLRKELLIALVAVYVDHGLRPGEVPGEIDAVQKAAGALDLPCKILHVDTRSFSREEKMSIEHAARELRYQALRGCAAEVGATRIAVAHTADDQVEELLLRMLRGSGRRGLAGMKFQNKDLIRPLLTMSKKRIFKYLAAHDIAFCHDSSNDDQQYLRNRIRHTLLPLLEKDFDPGIRKALLKTAAIFSVDEDFLDASVQKVWPQVIRLLVVDDGGKVYILSRKGFSTLHPCLQRRLVERLLWTLGCRARYTYILDVLNAAANGRTGSELHLSRGLRVGITGKTLEFSYPQGKKSWRGRLRDQE
jgi:tRNA(Ile)-lysidine synthase